MMKKIKIKKLRKHNMYSVKILKRILGILCRNSLLLSEDKKSVTIVGP